MYRCSECGNEYDIKPDFCECGNDIFVVIEQENLSVKSEKKTFQINKSDLLSWLIFLALIVLSILVLLLFPKISDKPKSADVKTTQQALPKTDIPNLYSFWIDCKPQTVSTEGAKQVTEIEAKSEPKPVQKTKTVTQQKTQKQMVQTKPASNSQAKPVQQKKKTVSQSTMPATAKPKQTYMSYEVVNYRTSLRQRLLSNLDIYKVVGNGKCGIEFSIDENGKLVNRRFIFQSDNKSVNDEVYKMLMRTPQFNPPPDGYANKKIRMSFSLDGESYEIKFID